MDKMQREFFGKARAISLTKGEKKQCLNEIRAFIREYSVRTQAQECHEERMKNKKQFVGKAKNTGLTTREKQSIFNAIKVFIDEHPIGAKEKPSPWWENFFSSIYFYVPAVAVILLLVVARGEYEQHPWKKSISPVRESVTTPPERQELILQLEDEAQDQANEDGETDQMFIRELDWMGEGDLRREWDYDEDSFDEEQTPSLLESEADSGDDIEEEEEQPSDDGLRFNRRRARDGDTTPSGDEEPATSGSGIGDSFVEGSQAGEGQDDAKDGDDFQEDVVPVGDDQTGQSQPQSEENEQTGDSQQQLSPPMQEVVEDISGPAVSSFSPSDGATNVSTATTISITFSEPVIIGTGIVIVREVGGNIVSTQISGVGTADISITLSSPLTKGTTYQVEVAAGAFKDNAGNPTESFTWTFTTLEPMQEETLEDLSVNVLGIGSGQSLDTE